MSDRSPIPALGQLLDGVGDAVAAIDDLGITIRYLELIARADALSAQIGDSPRLVLLEAENSVAWLIAYVAALRGRHAVLLVAPGDPAVRSALEDRFHPAARLTRANGFRPETIGEGAEIHPDLAALISTSGSTGGAKQVRLSHANLTSNAAAIASFLEIDGSDRGAANLPVHYSYGLSIVNSHLIKGATILLTSRSVMDDEFWAFLEEHGATSFAGVPHVYELIERVGLAGRAPSSLRYLTQAGGRLAPDKVSAFARLAEAHGWRFHVMYGQTEATARMAWLPPALASDHPGAIGQAIPGGRLELLDANGRPISAPNVDGELVYHGPNVMMGYASEAVHLAEPAGPDRLATGDLARRNAAGLYEITGRKSRFIKIFGIRIGLDDAERLLAAEGYDAVATGIDGRLTVASESAAAVGPIAALLMQRLGLPREALAVHHVDSYPRLSSGKIDYPALLRLKPQDDATPIANSAAMNVREREIATIWGSALGITEVGRNETFFDLGGDSLSALTVTLRMESAGLSPAAITRMLHGESIAQIAAAKGEGSRPVASLRARTGDAINMTRGLLVLLIIAAHWAPFLIERSGSYAGRLMHWSTPLFHAGTPGFALLFGVGLAYWYIPLRRRNPRRLRAQLRSNLRLVTAGLLVIALAILVRDMTTGEAPLHGWAVQLFYGVLLAYCLMLATAGPAVALIDRSRWPIGTALLLSLAFLGLAELCRTLFEGPPGNGFMEVVRLMLVAKYSYPRMLSYMAAGVAMGLAIGRYNEHRGFASRAALLGAALLAGDVALSIWLGVTERWFRPIGSDVTLLGYASLTLLLFALFFILAQRGSRGARLLSIVGILAFPLFIAQALVMPAKDILVAFAMPYALSVALPLGAFILAGAVGIRHFSRLYQGTGSSVP